jgi:deoxycytidylate deaminase
MLIDPSRNVVLMDGYNGGPRGGGELCGGAFCERTGLKQEDFDVRRTVHTGWLTGGRCVESHFIEIFINGVSAHKIDYTPETERVLKKLGELRPEIKTSTTEEEAEEWIREMISKHPGVKSGTHMELGCHHAEMNVICNCAAGGVKSAGAWMIVTGEPCMMCAKMIHHAGITKVMLIDGGYSGENGLEYLRHNNITIELVDGPKDTRCLEK